VKSLSEGTDLSVADRLKAEALRMFMVDGYVGLSMQEVRLRAGVSNGSLYHYFPSKVDLVAHLRVDGMRQCQDVVLGAVGRVDAEEGVRAVVAVYLRWVEANPEMASLLFADLPDGVLLAADTTLAEPNRAYVRVIRKWLEAHMRAGLLVERPFEIAHALWLGPTQEFCRHWLRGRTRLRPSKAAVHLETGAWRALSVAD
jgi:AcrR family transcriptional regulator